MNPLAKFSPNETCWCGSSKKYKLCHGNHRPASQPGEAVPPDNVDGAIYISPTMAIAKDALRVPDGGAALYMPTGRPEARPARFEDPARRVVVDPPSAPPPSGLASLGRLRVAVLHEMKKQIKDADLRLRRRERFSASPLSHSRPCTLFGDLEVPGAVQRLVEANHDVVPVGSVGLAVGVEHLEQLIR